VEEIPEHVQKRFKRDPPEEGDEDKPELPQQWRILVSHGIADPRDRNCANV